VVTPSDATRAALTALTGLDHVRAIPLAPRRLDGADGGDEALLRRHHLRPGGYFLTVAKAAPYKNLVALVDAYVRARPRRRLVITCVAAWRAGSSAGDLEAAVARAEGRVLALTAVDDVALGALYRGARALVAPSLIEGFGLVPLEAASLGVPCALSDIAAHRETLGAAALRFDPGDPRAIAAALRILDDDDGLCARLGAAGRARAAAFTWRATAERTLAAYEEALSGWRAASANNSMPSRRRSGTSATLVSASATANGSAVGGPRRSSDA
jgi:glycosyltransferase involved in cell wall biosynthesis